MLKINIITVNYNTEKDTIVLLKSLERLQKNFFKLKIYLVDNGSVNKFSFDKDDFRLDIELIRSEKNLGFAGGFNLGINEALKQNPDYILIINNDTKVYADMIFNMAEVFKLDETIGAVVPKIYFAKGHEFHKTKYKSQELGKVIWYAGGYTDWANIKSIHKGVDEVDNGQYDEACYVEFATGCCILFKTEVLEGVGLLDERYFLYYEDADLSERIRRSGWKIYYAPKACLIHVNAASAGGPGNNLHDYFLTRNQMLFGLTYAPLRSKIALIKQSIRLLFFGRQYQKKGIIDFYLRRFGSGTFFNK